MAKVVVTLKVLPEGPDSNLEAIRKSVDEEIKKFTGRKADKVEVEPVAFGIKALKMVFLMEEQLGSTEPLEERISKIPGVSSVEVVDVRRALG